MNRDNLVCRVGSCMIIYVNMKVLPATIAMDGLGGREDAIEGEERSRFPRGSGVVEELYTLLMPWRRKGAGNDTV